MATITRNNDDDDDEDFCFKRPSVRKSSNTTTKQIRQPVEHDEETSQNCNQQVLPANNSTSNRNITIDVEEAEKHFQEMVRTSPPDVTLLREANKLILRQLSDCLGQVVYGTPDKVCIIADYWGEITESKNGKRSASVRNCVFTMETDSEGVLLEKALYLNDSQFYHYPLNYFRTTPASFTPSLASTESVKAVGLGQFGKVFKAIDHKTEQEFAEKIITIEKFSKSEIKIHCQLNHKNIIKFFGAIRTHRSIHIFMQYAGGGSIQQLLQEGRGFVGSEGTDKHLFAEFWSAYYFKQILSALFYLHSMNIIHCDLKPSNVVLSSDRRKCYLTDFGEARIVKNNAGFVSLQKPVGTPNYIGPETIDKSEYHYASDIWSVACFLLHMLTGKVPWTIVHPSMGTYLLAITTRPFGILKEIPSWTNGLTKSILCSSFKEVSERKSLKELLELATRNLTNINRAKTREARTTSYQDSNESLDERTSSCELSLSLQEANVQTALAAGSNTNNEIIPAIRIEEPSSSAIVTTGDVMRYDLDEVSSSVSPPSLSLPEAQNSGDLARVSALLNSAASDSSVSSVQSLKKEIVQVMENHDENVHASQQLSIAPSEALCNGPDIDLSMPDGENLNGLANNDCPWRDGTDPTALEELSEILRQSSVEPEATESDADALKQLSSLLNEYDTELSFNNHSCVPVRSNATDKPSTSQQSLMNGTADMSNSPSTYDEDIDLSINAPVSLGHTT